MQFVYNGVVMEQGHTLQRWHVGQDSVSACSVTQMQREHYL